MSFAIIGGRNNGYPCIPELDEFVSAERTPPYSDFMLIVPEGGYPMIKKLAPKKFSAERTPPYPDFMFRCIPELNGGYPCIKRKEKPSGAFMNAGNLEYAYIPRSCKKIGEWAFTNTKLRRVKIAEDCEYFPTSFPPDCEIEFYGGGGEYGQLFDSEGYSLLDADGARIYVKQTL